MVRNIIAFVLTATVFIACSKNAITGRNQFKFLPEAELQSMAVQQYRQFLSSNRVVSSSNNRDAAMVRRVGQRITSAVTSYYKQQGLSNKLEGFNWEYNLVDHKDANAWVMPGGKIVVYTGLLPYTRNEAGLAVVLGHEISHAIFQHGNERMSQQMAAQGLGAGLSLAVANKPAATQNIFNQAFGVATGVGVMLPFARKHELEADRYGLRWMAMAGYNPREAVVLWKRMEQQSRGQKPPEFLSTHPSEGKRIQQLERYMPEALKYYKPIRN